jgi:hypothetical protein
VSDPCKLQLASYHIQIEDGEFPYGIQRDFPCRRRSSILRYAHVDRPASRCRDARSVVHLVVHSWLIHPSIPPTFIPPTFIPPTFIPPTFIPPTFIPPTFIPSSLLPFFPPTPYQYPGGLASGKKRKRKAVREAFGAWSQFSVIVGEQRRIYQGAAVASGYKHILYKYIHNIGITFVVPVFSLSDRISWL